ncbi:MAG TPA: protein kinase [Kineosporiaceae bacterium]
MSVPSAIGRLRVERRLGAGGFASVWLAHDPELDAPVAVKVLADNWAQDADVRRRFTDEARLLRRVDSDHLVRVYDVGELPDGRPYFVMTYADLGTLADQLAAHPAPWPAAEVLRIVDAIATGLAVLHGHGVVHRDLKPRNVLLRSSPDGPPRVLLGDLGIAKDLHWASGITMPAGSDGYMAPEQREYSAQVGPASDVHALAMTAAELLAVPGPPWPTSALGATLATATTADPGVRTSSAAAFADDLRRAVLPRLAGAPEVPGAPAVPDPRGVTQVLPRDGGTHVEPRPSWAGSLPPRAQGPAAPGTAPTAPGHPAPSAGPGRVAADPATPVPGRPGGRLGRRRALALGAGAVLVAGAAVAGRLWLTRDRPLTPSGGHVRVATPADLTRQEPVAFPGGTDTAAGARARSAGDARTVAVAWSGTAEDPGTVLGRTIPAGCRQESVRQANVGGWTGLAVHYVDCTDGSAEDDVALNGGNAATPWTVWVQVRSVAGRPALATTLSSLEVTG